jgi:type IV secretory pathway TraG/TraD family ATPase VirD4
VFVTDLKDELYELTAGWRHEHAHNRILRFEPAAASGSCCFNPMDETASGIKLNTHLGLDRPCCPESLDNGDTLISFWENPL